MADGQPDWDRGRVMLVVGALIGEIRPTIRQNLDGLTDDEYFWEPLPGSWGVRRRDDVRAPDSWGKGEWRVEASLDGLVTPPTTTIGWRLMHAYDRTNDFTSRAFGRGGLSWNDIEVPGRAPDAVGLMNSALDRLRHDLANHHDDVLVADPDPDVGRLRWELLGKAVVEVVHHCAEIGVLRTLYRRP